MSITGTLMRAHEITKKLLGGDFPGTTRYWDRRYARGGTSGPGSRNHLAAFKAEVLNDFVARQGVESVIEFGCGDGYQLGLSRYPRYFGVDASELAVQTCCRLFAGDSTKRFDARPPPRETFGLSLSLDVIFHLVEDHVFQRYMEDLFRCSHNWVIIYSSNVEENEFRQMWPGQHAPHLRHHRFSDWIEANVSSWKLIEHIPNKFPYRPEDPVHTSFSDFFVYKRDKG